MMEPRDTLDPATRDDQLVARLLEEITQRIEAGLPVDLEAYEREYPQHIERIRRAVPALQVLDELGLSAAKGSRAAGSSHSAPLGGTLGDYRIQREVGRGGMGIVYEAEQISLHRRVALKVMPFAAVLDPRHLQRFKNEAQAAASLKHPNIVGIHSVGCERGVHYYAMDYVEGQTLAEVIRQLRGARDQGSGARGQGRGVATSVATPSAGARDEGLEAGGEGGMLSQRAALGEHAATPDMPTPAPPVKACHPVPSPPHPVTPSPTHALTDTSPLALLSTEGSTRTPEFFRTVARLGIQAAEALEHAHGMGVVHRDIKPSNLMVDARGQLWITDFGLAMTQTETNLTMTGDVLGTLRYMSPEQLQAKHGVLDHRTDVYSLGLTLYELLTLQPAFPGDDRQNLIRQVIEDDPRPPRQLNKAIPTDLETIVLKATAKEPQSRYATAQQLADDLRRFVEDKPIQARRPSLAERAARWSRRHYWLVSRGIAASFAVLSITALAIFNAHLREIKQRQRAERNMVWALQVLDTVYLQYADEGYLKAAFASDRAQPAEEITPKTMEFLNTALGFYAQFSSANRDEPSVRLQVLQARIRVGECQSRLGSYAEAEQAFNNAISLAEKLVSEVQGPSIYQEHLARAQAGLADVAARQDNWDQVIVDLSHALRLDPNSAAAYNNRGVAYMQKGDFDQGIADFNQAMRLPSEVSSQTKSVLYSNRGAAYADKGDFDQAIADCNEAIRLDPMYASAYHNRGDTYREKRHFDRAIADFDEAIRLDPKGASAYNSRGVTYENKGQFDRAIADYAEAIRLAPKEGAFYNNRAITYHKKGEFERAIADYDEAIRLDPNEARIYVNRAEARAKLGQVEDALSDVAKALEINRTLQERSSLAWFLATCEELRLRRVDRALELAKLALKQAPKHAEIWTTLGAAEYRAGHWKAAVDALQKSSELKYYNVARTGFFRAMAHWQLGEKDEARQWYDKAVEWMEKNQPEDEELRRFRAEAAELLGIENEQRE